MGGQISTEPGLSTGPVLETSVKSSGSVKLTQHFLIFLFFFFAGKSIKSVFRLFQEMMFSTT